MRRLAVFLVAACAWAAAPSGHEDIDRVRGEVAASATTPANARERQALMYAWFRLLMHQGVDVREMFAIRKALGANSTEATPRICASIDQGYRLLERIQAGPKEFAVKTGAEAAPGGTATDWPVFHGNPAQTGFTNDVGPTQGKLAWRFPVGHTWYAKPSVEAGRVYIASPGTITMLYCLDEKTGKVIWKTPQHAWQIYETPRVSGPVVVLKDQVVVRETGSRGETGVARDLVFIDKATGKVRKEVTVGHLDYRHGYAPVSGDDRYILYPYGQQYIENLPPLVWNLDTVVCKDPRTGLTLWMLRVGDIAGDVVLEGDRAYVGTDDGTLYALNVAGQERIAWQFRAAGPIRGTPVLADGLVLFGANDGTFYALDAGTGRLKWSVKAEGADGRAHRFFSNAATGAGRVFFGAANGRLYAVDAASGRLAWQHRLNDWVRSRPAVVGGVVYAATMDGAVTALSASEDSARVLWSRKVSSHAILADLVAGENGVLASTSDLYLYSLEPRRGGIEWRHSLIECAYIGGERVPADMVAGGADFQSSPTAVGGRIYFGAPNRFVYALDSETGKELWRFETSGQVSGSPTVAEGRVYFGQQGGDKDFYAVNAATGKLIWKRPLGWAWVGAGYVQGRLIVGTVEGDIHGVRPATGEVLWTRRTTGGVYPSPATDGKLAITGAWGGHYFGIDPENGGMRWAFNVGRGAHPFAQRVMIGPDSGAPLITNGKLIVAPGNRAFAIDPATGKLIWQYTLEGGTGFNVTPATDGERVYLSTKMDVNGANVGARVIALDVASGKPVWQHDPGGGITGASVARGHVCFASTTDVHISCVDAKGNGDGTTNLIWRYRTGGVVEESCPAIYGDKLYVLAADRYFYALK